MIDVLSDLLEVGNIFGFTWSKMFHAEIIRKTIFCLRKILALEKMKYLRLSIAII